MMTSADKVGGWVKSDILPFKLAKRFERSQKYLNAVKNYLSVVKKYLN